MASLQRIAQISIVACSALLIAVPAQAAPPMPRSGMSGSPKASGSPLKIELPALGGRKVQFAYTGPIAPWKVLNPQHKGEREARFTLFGPKKSSGQTVHTAAVSSERESGVRRAGMSVSSSHTTEGSSSTKSLELGGSAERNGGSTRLSQHAAFRTQQSRSDGAERSLTVSGRAETARDARAATNTTREVSAESVSRRPSAGGGFDFAKQSAAARTVNVGGRATHEATAFKSEIARDGAFKEQGGSVQVGGRPEKGEKRAVVAKAGQVTGKYSDIEHGDGVIVKRGANGDVSTKLVDGNPNRTRGVTLGDETNHQSLPARLKASVFGEKRPAAATFSNGIPVGE